MTTKTSDLVETTRNRLQGTHRPARNQLANPVTAGATTLSLSHPIDTVAPGAILEVGLEQFHVWSTSTSGTVEVAPGVNGTTPAAHAAGDMVFINPEQGAQTIIDEINVDLGALSSPGNGLFAVQTIAIEYEPSIRAYELAGVARFLDVLEVRYETFDGSNRWPWLPSTQWTIMKEADATDFPSGLAIDLATWAPQAGARIRVACKTGFAPLTTWTDDVVALTGLGASMTDIPTLGAAARLYGAREGQRNLMGGRTDAQRAEEVPAGANIGSSRHFLALRAARISEERSALNLAWPVGGFR